MDYTLTQEQNEKNKAERKKRFANSNGGASGNAHGGSLYSYGELTKPQAQNRDFRIPPHSLDAEQAVLGSIMLRHGVMNDLMDLITDECFYSERHKIIFRSMIALHSEATPIDLLSLKTRLEGKQELEIIGGSSYLAELVNSVPSASNATYYAEIVQKKFAMRNLILASEHINQIGYQEDGALEEILDQAEKKIFEITGKGHKHKFVDMKSALIETWDSIEKLHNNKEELRGVPTGFKALDNKLAGLQKSDLIILAARPSMGKTTFALDIARHAAVDYKIPVCIFSLEMSSAQLAQRMLSSESHVDAWKLKTARDLTDNDFRFIQDGIGRLSDAPIYIDDQPGNNILKMRSFARKLQAEKGLGLIVVDYLQLMAPVQSKGSDNLVQQITEISRSLKNLARELDVPVLALSQLSRAVEQRGGKPRLSDLRDSGSIEQDADVVMFIHSEDRYKDHAERSGITEILIEKHRNGAVGMAQLKFDGAHTTFLNLDKSDFGDFAEHMGTEGGF
jgi:replicative DNA helicase